MGNSHGSRGSHGNLVSVENSTLVPWEWERAWEWLGESGRECRRRRSARSRLGP